MILKEKTQYAMTPALWILFAILSFIPLKHFGQEEAVREVLATFFDGMREGDSSKIAAILSEDIVSLTSSERDGEILLNKGSMERFLVSVGTPHEEVWDERIWDVEIRIDDHLASAWMKYAFYRGDQFSHCGVNHFLFAEQKDGWKVIHIADTRRKSPCEDPKP